MRLFFQDFLDGVQETLQIKKASAVFDASAGTSIIPSIEKQQIWHYARQDKRLLLNDGNIVHHFEIKGVEDPDNDFPLSKLTDVAIPQFAALPNIGKAQVHRVNPGVVYVTLHDGKKNPTYTLKHELDDQWRAIPKVKAAEYEIEAEELLAFSEKIANEFMSQLASSPTTTLLDSSIKGIDWLGRKAINGIMAPGVDPLRAAGIGLAGGAAYDIGKRWLYNTPEENAEENPTARILRYVAPAALLGGLGAATRSTFTNYYDRYPAYKA